MSKLLPRPQKILIIRLSSLGDIILTTPLIRVLRKRYPDARLDMLTKESFSSLPEETGKIDQSWAFPGNRRFKKKLIKTLARENYDTIIDLQDTFSSRVLVARLNPKKLYRFRRSRLNRWIRIHIPSLRSSLETPLPIMLGYLKAVEPLLVRDDGHGAELTVNPSALVVITQRLAKFRAENGLSGNMQPLIIAPGARHLTKTMPADKWVEFLHIARTEGFNFQIIIGSEADGLIAKQITEKYQQGILDLTGSTTIPELIALVSTANVLVTGDSAPMHIAAAVNTPLVAVFGSTVPEFGFAPIRCRHRIIEIKNLTCRPCHAHGLDKCPRKHFRCMMDIQPEDIMNAVREIVPVTKQAPVESRQ